MPLVIPSLQNEPEPGAVMSAVSVAFRTQTAACRLEFGRVTELSSSLQSTRLLLYRKAGYRRF